MMSQHAAAVVTATPQQPPRPESPKPASARPPMTTRSDRERDTYTSARSQELRERNIAAR